MIGVAKADSVIEIGQLEYAVRDVLNRTAPRRFGVLDPLKVVIENYPEGQVEEMEVVNNPEDPAAGTRQGAVLARAVDRARRLHGGARRRSSSASRPAARCACARPTSSPVPTVVKDAAGSVVELRCTYDPATRGGDAPDGRRPKATLHWLSAAHAVPAEVRLYDHLFSRPDPGATATTCSPTSTRTPRRSLTGAFVEPSLAEPARRRDGPVRAPRLLRADPDSTPEQPVFNRTLTLKDTWAKVQARHR